MKNSSTTTTYSNRELLHDVVISVALIRSRVALDKFRNKLFRYLDNKSKRLDDLAARKIQSLNISQYSAFREATGLRFDEYKRNNSTFASLGPRLPHHLTGTQFKEEK